MTTHTTPPRFCVENLHFAYPAARGQPPDELFGGLSHDFAPSSLTALTGPSGRGKSTLLYVLGLLLTPQTGTVLLDGVQVSALPDSRRSGLRADSIGFVFQDSELDPARSVLASVIEPALYAGGARAAAAPRALELLERFGLEERAEHRPGQVSGGQAQRLAVCRALLSDPDVILADEPTGNLDPHNASLVLDALEAAAADGRTVIIATHGSQVISRCEHVVRL